MKKSLSLIVIFCAALSMNAQTAKDAFNATEVVWYGLDFTKAKFVGQFDQGFGALPATGRDIRDKWIPQWNALIAKEPQNFKIKDAFRKDNVYYDMAPLNELNSKIDVDNSMSFNPGKIERSDIDAMVKNYGTGDKKSGIGLTFIIENFNKGTETADIHVTFFDIATKKVLFTEKISGKAMGVGMRNYWAGAIKSILKQIDAAEYKNWKAKA
jgi:hypothetical protein